MTNTAFDHLPRTARSHFLLLMYAAVYRLLYTVHLLDSGASGRGFRCTRSFPFLGGYFDEMLRFMPADITWEAGWQWWRDELARWEGDARDLPLLRLPAAPGDAAAGRLGLDGRLALILIGLVEEDFALRHGLCPLATAADRTPAHRRSWWGR